MKPDKVALVEQFAKNLMDNDIMFTQHANGHFKIYDSATLSCTNQVWVTTEKMIEEGTGSQTRGMGAILKKLGVSTIDAPTSNIKPGSVYCDGNTVGALHLEGPFIPARPINNTAGIMRGQLVDALTELKQGRKYEALVAAIRMPTGAVEIITNTQFLESKIDYYLNAYDSDLILRTCKDVKLVGILIV